MELEKRYLERARALHAAFPAADAHLDLAGELLLRLERGEEDPLRDRYLKTLRAGGFGLIVSSVYLTDRQLREGGMDAAFQQIRALEREIGKNPEFMIVRTAKELDRAVCEGRTGVLLYMEGLDCIGEDVGALRFLWERGVRGASLTWSRKNALASGCCRGGERINVRGGLTEAGVRAVREMERLGMFVDVSHLNDDGFKDLRRVAERPWIATHSNCRSVYFHYRNLDDRQLERLAEQGGVLGLNGCGCIVGCPPGAGAMELLCRHAEHAVSRIGARHVGYGFDFCDSYNAAGSEPGKEPPPDDCLGNHSRAPELTAALLQRGMKEEDVRSLLGRSVLDYFRKMLP
ncbi:MAG: membrane dipeptidase [Eubacteriales bacterium]|nr:membrane dipeptidase [Eubacteriales bacterium]